MPRRAAVRLAAVAATVLACLGVLAGCGGGASKPAPALPRPGAYYLSLGDSLGFGYQPDTLDFSHGYTDDFAAALARIRPGIKTVNYSCPGETTETMISGGCPFPFTHDPYNGPQLAAAVAFLHGHAGQVSPITVSIGANDALPAVRACATGGTCATADLEHALQQRLTRILGDLRGAAPHAEILLLEPYNPFAAAHPRTNDLVSRLDRSLVAAAREQRVRLADAFTRINVDPPRGTSVCSLTHFCSSGDVHPTTAGYRLIAQVLLAASGYEQRP